MRAITIGLLARFGSGQNVAAEPPSEYTGVVQAFSPSLHFVLDETGGGSVADASGNGLTGTINGTPAGFGVTTSKGVGIDLGGSADISLSHSSAFETDPAPSTADQDSYSEVAFSGAFIVNALSDNTALVSKCDDPEAVDPGWYAEAMADGSVRVHFISHRYNGLMMSTPAGTISQGVEFHLYLGLGYDGAWAMVDGQMLWDGLKCPLHWYGDDHRVLDINGVSGRNHGTVGTGRQVNTSAFRLGKVGSGGTRGDITVAQAALIYRNSPGAQLSKADAQTLAANSGSDLPHHLWGKSSASLSNGASAGAAQSAIDARSSAGGGTVVCASGGTYSWSSNVTMKDNVRLDLNGATVTMSGGSAVLFGSDTGFSGSSDDGGSVVKGQSYIVSSNLAGAVSVDDLVVLIDSPSSAGTPAGDSTEALTEMFTVRKISGSTVHFAERSCHDYVGRQGSLYHKTPIKDAAIIDGTINGASTDTVQFNRAIRPMLADVTIKQTATGASNNNVVRVYDTAHLWSPGGLRSENYAQEDTSNNGWHAYGWVCVGYTRGCVMKNMVALCSSNLSGYELFRTWHALSHSHGNRTAVDTKATSVEMEYLHILADSSGLHVPLDSHYTTAKIRWIDCAIPGNIVSTGAAGGGGILADGWYHEILRFDTYQGNLALKGDSTEAQEFLYGHYWRDLTFRGSQMYKWFDGDYWNCTTVDCTRTSTDGPDYGESIDHGGNVQVNCDSPLIGTW